MSDLRRRLARLEEQTAGLLPDEIPAWIVNLTDEELQAAWAAARPVGGVLLPGPEGLVLVTSEARYLVPSAARAPFVVADVRSWATVDET